jgi:hypothetical protein
MEEDPDADVEDARDAPPHRALGPAPPRLLPHSEPTRAAAHASRATPPADVDGHVVRPPPHCLRMRAPRARAQSRPTTRTAMRLNEMDFEDGEEQAMDDDERSRSATVHPLRCR